MATDESELPLSDDGKIPNLYQAEQGQAKFIKGDDSVDVKASERLIGLTKEQLEKYRNDPFWKPVRLTLFVLFWLAWIGMFVGAILIVVLSPKCAAKKEPEWWRTKVSYQVFTPTFRDSDGDGIGDFNGIREKLDEIRKIGIQNIWATPVIATHKDDFLPFDVVNFTKVDERFGTRDDFKALIDAIHDRGMHFVMDLPISTTSAHHRWFEDAKSGGEYRDYYVWRKSDEVQDNKDYVKIEGTDDAFLAYGSRDPVLNWQNAHVKKSIIAAAKEYLDLGVDGFHVAYVSQLMKNQGTETYAKAALLALEEFTDELETYIRGIETLNQKKVAVFTSLDDMKEVQPHDAEEFNVSSIEYVIDDSVKSLTEDNCKEGVAKCLHDTLTASLHHFERSELPHVWQFTDYRTSRLTSRFDVAAGNLLTFVQLCLPGAVEIYYGQEIGLTDAQNSTRSFTGLMQWDDSEHAGFSAAKERPFFATTTDFKKINFKTEFGAARSPLKTFKTLAKLRQRDDNLALGAITISPVLNDVLMLTRVHHDSGVIVGSVYIMVANFAMIDNDVDVSSLVPAERSASAAEIVAVTDNVEMYQQRQIIDFTTQKLKLRPRNGILIKV